MNFFPRTPNDSIAITQRILAGSGLNLGSALIDAVDDIVVNQKWRERSSAAGPPFLSFGAFARADQPHGLGVGDGPNFRLVEFALRERKHYAALTDLTELCVREKGRPPKKSANDGHFRFLTMSSANRVPRLLLTLKQEHPAEYAAVCAGELTPRQAAIRAGFVSAGVRRFGVLNLSEAARLRPQGQGILLRELWDAVALDVQCTFLSRVIEPVLGPELAQRWRQAKAPKQSA